MRLLFIKPKHIGDALLLTPVLAAAKQAFPKASIWVVVRQGTEGILEGCPHMDRLLTTAAPEKNRRSLTGWARDAAMLLEIRRQHFDYAFDLSHGDRGRLLGAWSGARVRCAGDGVYRVPMVLRPWFNRLSMRDWSQEHQVESGFHLVNEFLDLGIKEPPPLVFERNRTTACDLGIKLSHYAVLHPGTRWERKRWTTENWIQTGLALLDEFSEIIISAGPDPQEFEVAETITSALGPRAISTRGSLSWAQLAGLLYGAKLFIGVDTAAMHLAAACQCPTVALFGASVPAHWRPWRVQHRLLGGQPSNAAVNSENPMRLITPEMVRAAWGELLDTLAKK